ncbi:hypothetical protein GLF_1207 [Gluconobacter frateurii NBRC 101659]|nr:hypothetical protein GLF_1207 [Gluconobacter frateurii NBRC 101659]
MVPHIVSIIAAHPAGAAIISRAGFQFSSPGTPIGACAFAGP